MKIFVKLLLAAVVLLQFSCNKAESEINSETLRGVWVHTVTKTDTIDFNKEFFASEKAFILKRGTEIRDGYTLPKMGSDMYRYEVKGDSIYITGMLWSCWCKEAYYFKMNPDRKSFFIGNIAPFTGGLMVNEFRRIDE